MLKITVEELPDDCNLEKAVDEDIFEFSEFFRGLGNDPVVSGEKAIIKTYLAWKLGLGKGGESP